MGRRPYARLAQAAEEIRRLYATGTYTQVELAKRFETQQSAISTLVKGETYKGTDGPVDPSNKKFDRWRYPNRQGPYDRPVNRARVLSAELAVEIRTLYQAGHSQSMLADRFKVSPTTICGVLYKKTYRFAGGPKYMPHPFTFRPKLKNESDILQFSEAASNPPFRITYPMILQPLNEIEAGQYRPMQIGDSALLIDGVYRQALPNQWIRELVKNSQEAGASVVRMYPDWSMTEKGIYRFCIADNGKGMTQAELIRYFNRISESGKITGTHGNYGLGAKVATLPWNHHGVIVMSWVNGVGKMIRIGRIGNTYALLQTKVEDEDGNIEVLEAVDADESCKPDFIGEHGTVIILTGNTGKEDTYLGPGLEEEEKLPLRLHTTTLNERFFELPKELTIQVCEFSNSDKRTWPRHAKDLNRKATGTETKAAQTRTVMGFRDIIERHARAKGTIVASDAKIHWYLWEQTARRQNLSSFVSPNTFFGVLYDNEIYNVKKSLRQAGGLAHQFGVMYAQVQSDLVIIVEPKKGTKTEEGVHPTPSRDRLMWAAQDDLPWSRWGAEFHAQMPEPIREAIERVRASASQTHDSKGVREKLLKVVPELLQMWRRHGRGKEKAILTGISTRNTRGSDSDVVSTTGDREEKTTNTGKRPQFVANVVPNDGATVASGTSAGGVRVSRVNTKIDTMPKFDWCSLSEKTRTEEELVGRAVQYNEPGNVVRINRDYKLFIEQKEHFLKQYPQMPGIEELAEGCMREVYEFSLGCKILQAKAKRGTLGMSLDDVNTSLSEVALTVAVDGIFSERELIRQKLAGHLRGLKTAA